MVPCTKQWYTASSIVTTVCLQQVIEWDISLLEISTNNKLPRTGCNKKEANWLKAKRVSDKDNKKAVEIIERCIVLDFDENLDEEEDDPEFEESDVE